MKKKFQVEIWPENIEKVKALADQWCNSVTAIVNMMIRDNAPKTKRRGK